MSDGEQVGGQAATGGRAQATRTGGVLVDRGERAALVYSALGHPRREGRLIPQPETVPDPPDAASAALAARLHQLMRGDARRSLACAESCTGGLIAHRITAHAGSSDYFQGSAVTYSNAAKRALLGVPQDILDRVGAVSEECAAAMAEGALRAFDAELAVATTGIAGPGGGTSRKPVGLVYVAVAGPGGTVVAEHRIPGDRAAVVEAAAAAALAMLIDRLDPDRPVASSPTA